MRLSSYTALNLALSCVLASVACDNGGADNAKPAAAKPEPPAKPVKKAPVVKAKKGLAPGEVALPWKRSEVLESLKAGTVLLYDQSGKTAKGKNAKDSYRCQVKKADDSNAGVLCGRVNKPSKDPGATQVATMSWTQLSPFFAVERPTPKLTKRETIKVAAGEFDCVVAELQGFMGNHKTVWMAVDKPGVYAKVIDHGNTNMKRDKTNIVFELAEITTPGG